ncbi:MAG: hypothetical protein WB773_03820, partial [Isosphaeraceae bacterium]
SEMSQNAGSEEAERHGTRFSALFLGILSTQSRIGPGCLATVSFVPGLCENAFWSEKNDRFIEPKELGRSSLQTARLQREGKDVPLKVKGRQP